MSPSPNLATTDHAVQQLAMTARAPRIPNQRMKRTVRGRKSSGEYVELRQGDYVKFIDKKFLSKDHPFLEHGGYDQREEITVYTAYGFVLVDRSAVDMDA